LHFFVVVVVVVKTMMGSSVASVFSSSLLLLLLALLSVVQAEVLFDSNLTIGRNTLSGAAPLIIANGGTSGLYPDQTAFAYQDALNTSSQPLALSCDLQLTKDNLGICRTGLNLTTSTFSANYNVSSTYIVNGVPTHGYFSVDYMQADLLNPNFTTAVQPNLARSPFFDQVFPLLSPDTVGRVHLSSPTTFWLNVEYPSFFQQHPGKNSLASYLTDLLASPSSPAYLSATEVGILRLIGPTARRSRTSLILKVLDPNTVEQSTNTTYGTLLQNLLEIRTYASGILVPKNLIWPINDKTQYLQAHTNLVEDAHKAKLAVYAYDFANDQYPNSFNYSFDPIAEYLAYVGQADFSVDGVLTDFPSTASEAINCYTTGYKLSLASKGSEKTQQNSNKLVISHNGDSGDFPGCTMLAYTGAINGGSDYIDCPIQITSDSVPICREDANLIKSTDILTNHALWQTYYTSYAGFQNGSSGVFTFDVPWADISTLRALMYSPNAPEFLRNTANDNVEGVLTLANFLQFAKSNPGVGIYIDIQNAVYLRTAHSLDVVDAVINALKNANLTSGTDKVLIASEDSSVLLAFQQSLPFLQRVYHVPSNGNNPDIVTLPVLQEIKTFAGFITIPAQLVDPTDDASKNPTYFLAAPTQVVKQAHDQNLTVLYYFAQNEFSSFAFDYRADPIMHINSLVMYYNVDGIITDFPATVYDFLHKNQCYKPTLSTTSPNYSMLTVVPGAFFPAPADATAPTLQVSEPPISFQVPGGPKLSPTAAKSDAAATKMSLALFSTLSLTSLLLCELL